MTVEFTEKPRLNGGIFTSTEIARFLQLSTSKVSRWMRLYWDGKLSHNGRPKSWKVNGVKAVDFSTMIEIVVLGSLVDAGAPTFEVIKAHIFLAKKYDTATPFTKQEVLNGIKTDGHKVYLDSKGTILNLDGSGQTNLEFLRELYLNLEFSSNRFANRFWPRGKENSIVVDPKVRFGHPVINGKNIYPETIYGMVKAGDPPAFISELYDLTIKEVQDAIEYCSAA